MGRLYAITMTPAGGSSSSSLAPFPLNSQVNGVDNPGALNVEFDFLEYTYGTPMGNSTLAIHGPPLSAIFAAQQFVGMQLTMRAGMSTGLPLATAAAGYAGTIMQGQVFQAFGNWAGTEMTLDFVVVPSIFTFTTPGNFVLSWKKGTSLQDALQTTFSAAYQAFPNVTSTFTLGNQYTAQGDVIGVYHNFAQLAQMIKSVTKSPSAPNGVDLIFLNSGKIVVTDYATPSSGNSKQIQFIDLIGQPTWINPNVIQFATVMRADIKVGDTITFPQGLQDAPGIVTTSAASWPSQLKYQIAFQGSFIVQSVRQIGNFRDPNGLSWATVFQAAAQSSG